ncbi:hypothetical protein N7448_007797 [Penicillium atrosanguineum]|uniref:Uncharacterized protein n=1 Tax=Penicillium atrosanguineum TaxID=1132637 RepID=A0A9W9GPY9_9EURO|nr:uncharacterized protein N7443_001182 [Penicillium atrosanguineum]KAJ5127018.1 hypothetical protein N7448_007797 [Penicillium atrosanguineum]KAJ5314298.1 hypothetical protein N7443_001182 [Penicillium atrosanguineum]KAJ5331465.1 hypothetical protein N7476_001248 [Penicillium atrosanguineum]
MPPRKKAKRAHSATPQDEAAAQSSANTPGSSESAGKPELEHDFLSDPWTDEQETALLKAIIKWKPVGLHKHFRMLAIADYLKSQGFGPSTADHMRIPGIWKKLGTLYNLEALDERENSVITGTNDDDEDNHDMYCPFELPYDEYGDMMFERRLAAEGSSSPETSRHAESRRGSTVANTDEPRSSPAPSRGRKSTRGTRSAARETRSTKLAVEVDSGSQGEASDEDGKSDGEDTGANDEGEEEGDEGSDGKDSDGEEEEAEEEKEEEKGGSRSTRAKASTSKSKPKDKKASTSTGTRRTARRR